MLKKLVRKASMTTLRLEEIFSNVESSDSIYDGLVDTNVRCHFPEFQIRD